MRLTLVRHAQSIWNAEDRWQGQSDVPLSELGRAEATKVGARLRDARFDRIVSSDLSRALDTARAIAGDRVIETSRALREMNLGNWCGRLHSEIAERHADELRALALGEPVRIGGDGETVIELQDRVLGAIASIEGSSPPDAEVLVVTHGGVIRAILLSLLGLSGRERPLIGSGNTGITELSIERGIRALRVYNDQHHLGVCLEEGDEQLTGDGALGRVCEALGLTTPPIAPLAGDACAVLKPHTRRGQLRRWGVAHPEPRRAPENDRG